MQKMHRDLSSSDCAILWRVLRRRGVGVGHMGGRLAPVALSLLLSVVYASTSPPTRVVVVGGTHGNEFTGVYVIEHLRPDVLREKYPSLQVETLLANPRAHESNQRFVDDDLNRQFSQSKRTKSTGYEALRAAVLNQAIGPKG
jgi:N-acyl-aromatic-L-amino acid amidohydrolase